MENLKKILEFIVLFLGVIGIIGTIGWLIYSHAWVILAGFVVVLRFAIPQMWKEIKEFINS